MPGPIVAIKVGTKNWEKKAKGAIDKKKRVRLTVKGVQAQTAGEALRRGPGLLSGITGAEVALGAAIVVGIVAVVGLGVMAAVCLYGINKGYKIKARHKTHGPMPFDDELIFDLQPPA